MSARAVRIEGDVAYIPLGQGLEAMVDACDVHLVGSHNWRASRARGKIFALRVEGTKTLYLHRFLLGAPQGKWVEHTDGNGLDNRRCNLQATSGKYSLGTERGAKELAWSEPGSRWHTEVCKGSVAKKVSPQVAVGRAAWPFGASP